MLNNDGGKVTAEALQQCLLKAGRNKRVSTPSLEDCELWVPMISQTVTLLGTPTGEQYKPDIKKSGRRFLRDLGRRRSHIEDLMRHMMGSVDPHSEDPHKEKMIAVALLGSYPAELSEMEPAEKIVRSLLELHRENRPKTFDWRYLVHLLLACGGHVWARAGTYPKALKPGSPLCLFVWYFLDFIGQPKGQAAISGALKIASAEATKLRTAKEGSKKLLDFLYPEK
jgi:hypothetical protein